MAITMSAVNPELKPLVLLDIDGVVNMSKHTFEVRNREFAWLADGTYWSVRVALDTEDALYELFVGAHEVMWCTAWRYEANKAPLNHLRSMVLVDHDVELGVITNGESLLTDGWVTKWKVAAVRNNWTVKKALAEGRAVYWIEDFNWSSFDSPVAITEYEVEKLGIRPIDTGIEGRLIPEHLREFTKFSKSTEAS